MITLTGIFSESFGGTCTIRGYAKYTDIVNSSFPHPDYQRPEDPKHIDDISKFILSGSNSFSPEVVLAYTAEYDYYAQGAKSEVNAIEDIRIGKGFTSNKNGVSFKKQKAVENGYVYEIKVPDNKDVKPFRRIDGNHRLKAFEKLDADGQAKTSYLIPFCLVLFAEGTPLKDEKIIFHNINSKAIPIKSEQLLKSVIVQSNSDVDFSDDELRDSFGFEYLLARRFLTSKPLLVRKLKSVNWIKDELMTVLVELISFVGKQAKIETEEEIEAFFNSISKTIEHAIVLGGTELSIASGLFFLLTQLYYDTELNYLDPEHSAEKYKNNLLRWAQKYQITNAQNDTVGNAASNAKCIKEIFEKYKLACEQTIFMSRCFGSEYDETEFAIRRVIDALNDEKHSLLKLTRVDQHNEGATAQISDRVFRDIEKSGLVIADLSSGKLNIPHEIGYAMGLKKDLIIIHNGTSEEAEKHTPSNIKMFEQIRFNGDYQKLERELKARLIDYYKL